MTEYRESEGQLVPEVETPYADSPFLSKKNPGFNLKSLEQEAQAPAPVIITPADLQDAIDQADKDPAQRQQAMGKIQDYLDIARPSAPESREVKYFTRELKRLENAAQ